MQSPRHLRQDIRQRRKNLSQQYQHQAAYDLVQQCSTDLSIQKAQSIAIYLSADGEIGTHLLIEWLWEQGKNVFLPVIHPFSKGYLLFLEYDRTTPLIVNKYQIREPKLDKTKVIPISELDLILTPLVAFDHTGNRLGMGGGYYDRTLKNWHQYQQGPMPIGIAHSCQQVDILPVESWDVPLPRIITSDKIWKW
ncbi:5-formyltetrahydrofolate cyclo-ligase [Aliivibrio salmonicida]|uniref:5-formyltetrahydrofolate cyclo-ligase n=1 Tax=Aliivibrio salmonicida (strain LFI1238) TaxID=316275 RepID=B6EKP5_ALISL|nr:5-formyltetrahydrofolate cyclo-ligase [Aliivibrio salmonicida]AZL85663.1 5-formyltetrahydrofolate cyclo-ligase [Aliivibrio salmonicida]CAQ80225.1 putative 5-formyltetrahydrofolate cyclo-ligase [Aliivibrio salmonicida LFI1238]